MIDREICSIIQLMATKMPVISITGPRQSGKTTVAKMCFPHYDYVNLENPDTLDDAKSDPRLFLSRHKHGLIIDEIQGFPSLFSYIQTLSDEHNKMGEYILTGSQNFLISEKISQSLAGRVFITHLLPLSMSELKNSGSALTAYPTHIFKGFYPRLYSQQIEPPFFYPSYIQTYVERDVRQIVNISDVYLFQKFIRLAAGRVAQMVNYNSIATELGVDLKTIKSWFSILQTSFVVFFLPPHFQNFSKRIVKTPKLYFYDSGLVCSLLGIKKEEDIQLHWAKGALFENMIIADLMKNYFNKAEIPPLYFWRDNSGNEVDCIIDEAVTIKSIEIKSSTTISSDFFKGLNIYKKLNESAKPYLLYGGQNTTSRKEAEIVAWNNTKLLLD